MKKQILLILILGILTFKSYSQNSPLTIYGNGLDGSTYQMTAIYSDSNGLILEAPLNSSGIRLPIQFNWRGSGTPSLFIDSDSKIGIGTNSPNWKLHVKGAITAEGDGAYNYADFNLKNGDVRWHISGPRYTENNRLGIFWDDGISYYDYLTIATNGSVGIGTSDPKGILHIKSESIDISSSESYDANMLIEATCTSRTVNKGAALGFVVPANSDGSNPWQQGRILVTPDNTNNTNASGRMYLQTRYFDANSYAWKWRNNLVLSSNGYIGIGTIDPVYSLDVIGTIRAREVIVDLNGADFVFENDYKLMPLNELEKFLKEQKHLPEIASAKEMEKNGTDLGDLNSKLLQKMEEMTLYMIEQNKKIEQQNQEMQLMKEKITKLEAALN